MLKEAANSSSSLSRASNLAALKIINAQENRRPLLHRQFGTNQQIVVPASSSVGAVSRASNSHCYIGG
jgi:hypothetical protein